MNSIRLPQTLCFAGLLFIASAGIGQPMTAFGDTPQTGEPKGPLSAKEALDHFQLHPSFKIELVAAEPEVIDPIAIAFDEQNRMWVVEMGDYPNGPKPGELAKSRIRVLRDKNNDGVYETSTTFVDRLLFATGVQPWKEGVIVTFSGQVAYFKDLDGDDKADLHEVWYTGFEEKNPQLRANHPTLGIDNRIYVSNGLRGGVVVARHQPWSANAKPVSISGRDFSFNPLTGEYQAVAGVGQFGLTFNDYGQRFTCSNRNPCMHHVIPIQYVERNPKQTIGVTNHDVSPAGADSRIFPISKFWTTSTLHEGQFTAACGVTMYRGNLLAKELYGNSFTCDPTGNLVHRDILTPAGATYNSKPGREGVEFLATKDEWFRPVNLAVGPEGALYVVDIYRAVIEHPQFVPDELKNRPDERYGDDRGRIYRIVPAKGNAIAASQAVNEFASQSPQNVIGQFEHANCWQRETAARSIYEKQDASIAEQAKAMAKNGKTPQSRSLAMWALNGINQLDDDTLLVGLSDASPRVREQAVKLSESRLNSNSQLAKRVAELASDSDARLRFQVALSLGELEASKIPTPELATIALSDGGDIWTHKAVLTSIGESTGEFFGTVMRQLVLGKLVDENYAVRQEIVDFLTILSRNVGTKNGTDDVQDALLMTSQMAFTGDPKNLNPTMTAMSILTGLGDGLRRHGITISQAATKLEDKTDRENIESLFSKAIQMASQGDLPTDVRSQAISLLRHADYNNCGPQLLELALNDSSQTIRLAALETLRSHSAPEIGEALVEAFSQQTPVVRRTLLGVLLARPASTKLLLDQVEAKNIALTEISASDLAQLTRHRDQEISERAKTLQAQSIPADRKEVLAKYQAALTLKADPKRGVEVFKKNCATCHRVGKHGVNVAPDIGDSRTRTPATLLTNILDPNRAIDNNYFSYNVIMNSGKVHTGIITSETATSITIKQPEAKVLEILRSDIDELQSTGISLMPVGLEKSVPLQDMADLISYIKNWRYLDGQVPISVSQ